MTDLTRDELMEAWHALAQYVENHDPNEDGGPDPVPAAARSALSKLDALFSAPAALARLDPSALERADRGELMRLCRERDMLVLSLDSDDGIREALLGWNLYHGGAG